MISCLLGPLALLAQAATAELDPAKLEALHRQRVEWMKVRRVDPPHGVYQDFRIASAPASLLPFRVQELAKAAGVQILLTERQARLHNGVLWMARPASLTLPSPPNLFAAAQLPKPREIKRLLSAFRQYPVEFAGLTGGAPLLNWFQLDADQPALFAPVVQHVLAQELSEAAVAKSIAEGRTYTAEEWLCETNGFSLLAVNQQGVFEIGDRFPMQNKTRIQARLPVQALLRLYRGEELAHEAAAQDMAFEAKEPGAYRLEADLDAAGVKRPWIRTQPIYLLAADPPKIPALVSKDDAVVTVPNIAYVPEGEAKQTLDLYLPKGRTHFPVFVFVHGGAWATGDKNLYAPIGVMLAKKGIGVAIPSYRLMPKHAHPAQIEDVAAAFAWVVKNIAAHGADPQRIFLGGHSAGGHLSALLALDKRLLAKHDVDASVIRGVAALSGVYDLSLLAQFGDPGSRKQASPMTHVRKDAPPFLVSYCQWDYLTLPFQAKEFTAALKRNFVPARLLYVPGETHISEVLSMLRDGDPSTAAIVRLVETGQP